MTTRLELKLEDHQLKSMISEAIYKGLEEGRRELLIKEALAELFRQDQYSGVTPITRAFRDAVTEVAKAEATKMLVGNEEFGDQLKKLLSEAVERFFDDKCRELMIQRIISAMQSGLLQR